MRLILGLDHPTCRHRHDRRPGRTGELTDPLRIVGALLDARQAHPNRSARNHLRWIASTNRIPAKRVDEVLEMVGLSTVAGKKAGTLSLGMGQRLGIAAALLGDPPVLLFDEPVNGLDPEGIRWVRTLMRTLAAEGRTVFVSSHLLAEMANTADRLVVIGRGKLIASTTVSEFVSRSGADTVRVRSPQLEHSVQGALGRGPDDASRDGEFGAAGAWGGDRGNRKPGRAQRNYLARADRTAGLAGGGLYEAHRRRCGIPDGDLVNGLAVLNAERIKLSTTRSSLWSPRPSRRSA